MKFKKIVLGLVIAALAFGAVACTDKSNDTNIDNGQQQDKEEKELTGSLEEIMTSIYEGIDEEMPMVANTVLTEENVAYFAGIEKLDGNEGLASEAMINAKAHSVVLVKAKEGTDIEALKKEMKEKVDPRKWICVGVEREEIIVDNIGNTVILIIDDQVAYKIHESFLALGK
ncbi:hypothetical protein JYG23_03125 [Sedimentibacter sp. zth1]|uniref:hypothetical protein n=1 Tax=Sedimentibacter sp. zth1 TaxID=2816908 RepID=UPI001A91A2CF|nr:hypothetical protein [Sedimentibacter sp. zth1]QSX06465.1 hypothetical protein JYG23_03125 [Sedimentibacter sp. zth1]